MSSKSSTHSRYPILQGWLEKQKSTSSILGGDTNRRWFTIESIHETDNSNSPLPSKSIEHLLINNYTNSTDLDKLIAKKEELALCYYKNPSSKDKSGWIFLSDVTDVIEQVDRGDNGNSGISYDSTVGNNQTWIHVCHPSRTYKLRGEDRNEHNLWLKVLRQVCGVGLDTESDQKNYENDDLDCAEAKVASVSIKATKKMLQPARSPIYEREYSYAKNESNMFSSPFSSKEKKNHEAEIEFIRDITSGSKSEEKGKQQNDLPISHRKFHSHNDKLVEESEDNLGVVDSFTPAYHEIITKSGIEQHTLLSAPTPSNIVSNPSVIIDKANSSKSYDAKKYAYEHDHNDLLSSISSAFVKSIPDSNHNQNDEKRQESLMGDHRFNNATHDAEETIHKRIERAIKNYNNKDDESKATINERKDKTSIKIDSEPKNEEKRKIKDSKDSVITMVETLSLVDDDDASHLGCFLTPKSKSPDELEDPSHGDNRLQNGDTLRDIQLVPVSFHNDVLSLNVYEYKADGDNTVFQHFGEIMDSAVSLGTPKRDELILDLSLDHECLNSEEGENQTECSQKQMFCESFDTDCSYRPDENFVEEDWD